MPPTRAIARILPSSLSPLIHPQYWQFTGLFIIVLVTSLLSIQTIPALAKPEPSSNFASGVARSDLNPGSILLRSQFRSHIRESDSADILSLDSPQGPNQRIKTISRLVQSGKDSSLIAAMTSPKLGIRLGAIQVLGWKQDSAAAAPLIRVSFDPNPTIREAAFDALGEIGSPLALPRLQQAQVSQSRYYVQEAAYLAEQRITARLADQLGFGISEIRAVSVASQTGTTYAVTSDGLYVRHESDWERIKNIPDVMTGVLATSSDGRILYLGTMSGLYASQDGGMTWTIVLLPASERPHVRATAVLVDPANSKRVFVALASSVTTAPVVATPLGIYVSSDEGNAWAFLTDSPRDYLTTRLSLDPTEPRYLFGATGVGTWRYTLTETVDYSHPN